MKMRQRDQEKEKQRSEKVRKRIHRKGVRQITENGEERPKKMRMKNKK